MRKATDTGGAAVLQTPLGAGRSAVIARLRRILLSISVLASLGLLWQLGATAAGSIFFPALTDVLGNVRNEWFDGPASRLFVSGDLVAIVAASFSRLFPAFVLASLIGVGLGVILGLVEPIRDLLYPVIHFIRAIPAAAKVPLFIVLLGVDDSMKIWLIGITVAAPILITTVDGVRAINPTLLDTARSYHLNRRDLLFRVILPAASPQIASGFRVATAISLVVLILVEWQASSDGLGYYILYSQRRFQILDMWSGILLVGVFGGVFAAAQNAFEHRLLRWHRGARADNGS